jgi:hypothetical protein
VSGARGTGRLALATGEVEILFTNLALAEAETLTGKSVLQLADTGRTNALGMRDVAQLLLVGMEHARRAAHAGGPRVTLKEAFAIMDEVGFIKVAEVVLLALAAVLSYGAGAGEEAAADPLAS